MGEGITVAITTFNRAPLWRTGRMRESLCAQTRRPDEVLIVDDNSTDDTVAVLQEWRKTVPFPVRLIQCRQPKLNAYHANVFSENVALARATGKIYLHLDDDGWVHPGLVDWVSRQDPTAAWYGLAKFYLEHGAKFVGHDWRRLKYEDRHGPVQEIARNSQHRFGPIWACPLTVLREIGGHDMSMAAYRGSDVRLGDAVGRRVPCWLVMNDEMTFHHYGWPWSKRQNATGQGALVNKYRRLSGGTGSNGIDFWSRINEMVPHEEVC